MFQIIRNIFYFFKYEDIAKYTIIYSIVYMGYILIVPYFYNYYQLLKEEKENGK